MEANSTGGGPPPGDANTENKWTEAQLEMIHAAMMEELGVGRKDTLPLDDKVKGKAVQINVRKPVKKQLPDDPNDPTARWRNIQFDDVDPTDAELDSMYDGQLYRLRKEATGETNNQGFSSGRGGRGNSRGRGGSTRGGHSGSGRGGREPLHTNRRFDMPRFDMPRFDMPRFDMPRFDMPSPSIPPYMSGRNTQVPINDARRSVRGHPRGDVVIASMRAMAAQAEATREAAQRREADALIAEQRRRVPVNAGASRRPQAPDAVPRYLALASQDAFLAYAGFTSTTPRPVVQNPQPTAQDSSRHASLGVTSKEDHDKPSLGPVNIRLPQPPQRANDPSCRTQQNHEHQKADVKSKVIDNSLATSTQSHTMQNGDIGLEGSRWATSTLMPEVTPSTVVAAAPPIVKPNTLAPYGRIVLTERPVQVAKGRAAPIRGSARLVKNNPQQDRYFTIELDVDGHDDAKNVLKEEIRDGDMFTCESTVIKYRAQRSGDGTAPKPATTWTIKFQIPRYSWEFYNTVASNPNARNRYDQPDIDTTPEPDEEPMALTQHQPTLLIEKSVMVDNKLDFPLVDVKDPSQADTTVSQDPSKQPLARSDGDIRSTVASAGSRRVSISNSSLIFKQEPEGRSTSPQRAAALDWAIMQPIQDPSLAGLLDEYHPGGSDRISTQAWSEMHEVAGLEPLVSLGHDEVETETIQPMIQALLNMDDTQLIKHTLDYLNSQPGGSFLHQLSVMVAKENVPAATELTGEEILSLPQYQEAAENLVGGHLCHSETFSMMPDIVTIGYTTEKARKVLKKSVTDRESYAMSEHGMAPQFTSGSGQADTGLSISQHHTEAVTAQISEHLKSVDLASYYKADGPRIIYTAETLLSLRKNASRFQSELISKEVAGYIIPKAAAVKSVNPANILGLTRDGHPIVAGRDYFSRTRRNSDRLAFAPATTVGGWQDYSAAESEDSIVVSRNVAEHNPGVQSRELLSLKPLGENVGPAQNPKTPAPIKKALVMSPPKPANTVQAQETDMSLWDALLTKKEDRDRAMSSSKSQTPLVSSRGSRHVPTNSEFDRLAETFEGLHVSKKGKEEPSELTSEQASTMKSEQDSSRMKLEQESSAMMAEQGSSALKSEESAASHSYSVETQPRLINQARPATLLSMYQKILDNLSTSSPSLSSRSKSMISTTPTQSMTNAVKSETGSIPPTPTLPVATSSSTSELKAEHAVIGSPNDQAPAIHVPTSTNLSEAQPSLKVESPKVTLSSVSLQLEKDEPSPATSEPEPNNFTYIKSEPAPAQVRTQPAAPLLVNATAKNSETVAELSKVSEKAILPEGASNKDLKGVLGLKASRWAPPAPAPAPPPLAPRAPSPRVQPTPPLVTASPIFPVVFPHHPYNPQQTFGNFPTPPPPLPVPAAIASHSPTLETVFIADPLNPEGYIELTGTRKNNAQTTPSMMPIQQMLHFMNVPDTQENVPYLQQPSSVSPFESRAEVYRGHTRNKSSGSVFKFNPSNTPFTPSRGRGANAMSPQERTALSPLRLDRDAQSRLQSRLNSSLAGRSPEAWR